jgi:hypothetical protein
MHQITAYGGEKPVPFSQAIPQSPGYQPLPSKKEQEKTFQDFLDYAGVSTIEEARKLSFHELMVANTAQVGNSPYGWFIYGPTYVWTF